MKLSQIWRLFEIIKQILGLVKQAEDVVADKPAEPATENPAQPPPAAGPVRDPTDKDNKFHLNQ